MSKVCLFLAFVSWMGTAASKDMNLRSDMTVSLSELGDDISLGHSHQTVLDPEGIFTVLWTPDFKKQEVIFELHVRTLGWFGFGFSSNGGMRGADIVTAWIKDGQLYLQDRHGVGDTRPPLDDHGDWRPLHARENDTHTILIVARDINTCDPQDYALTNETVRMIYAWDDQDPLDDSGPNYHGQQRGNRFALVLLPFHHATVKDDIQTWRVRQKKKLPHKRDTFYWCHIEAVPKPKTKHHYIGFDMLYGQNSRKYLHHAVAFECVSRDGSPTSELFEQYVGHPGFECYTPNMPPDFYLCERFLINWAIGSEGELLPDHVGYPLGDLHGGADYVLFQTHYDNKPMHADITVEWGMDIYFTDKLREQDAGNIALGHSIVFSLTVPPRTPHWLVSGHCASECTAQAIPEEGIHVFMVFLHGHYLARAIRLRHFRGGRELRPIATDASFDADFQQSRMLTEEVKILPGDHLTVECDYESLSRANGTYSGWAATDEMCQAFINYYPRINLALCRSATHPSVLQDLFGNHGVTSFPEELDLSTYVFDPEVGGGRRYQEVMNSLPWESLNKEELNERIVRGDQAIKCQYTYGQKLEIKETITRYPKSKPYVAPEDAACSLRNHPSSKGQDLSYTLVVSSGTAGGQKQKQTAEIVSGSKGSGPAIIGLVFCSLLVKFL
ncbi:DBH-like monooxygenase protein 1 [Macrobrachium nipponense]|uniref:DBH-like monooxygenase protein 1 n=1 Tax=Macrobrachium nipponense TaxID=159736 RepID=UPI0030C89491